MSLLSLTALSVRRAGRDILSGIDLTIGPGEFVGLIGPNGAGKSTLLRAALGLLPAGGHSSLAAMAPRARAKAVAWLPQSREIAWPVSVEALVMLGRVPHGSRRAPGDLQAVEGALAALGLAALRDRPVTALSGGEQARALLARALAQETPLILADEPISSLDPAAQISAMRVLAARAHSGAVVAALHDLGLAARHCTRLVLLAHGAILADGPPAKVLTPANLAAAFGIRAFYEDRGDGPIFQPLDVI